MFISVVVPIYNEEESIPLLYAELKESLVALGEKYEILFIDDGSRDNSPAVLKELVQRGEKNIKVIRFRRNFGQTAAISAGFNYSQGDFVVTIDADLQNDPRDIKKLLDVAHQGYEIVSGWRQDRKDTFLTRRLPSIIANRLISKLTSVHLHDYGCTLKVYHKDVVNNLNLYGETHRFIPALASWMGVKVTEVVVNHRPRKYGKSKYGLGRTFRVILDLINVKFLLSYSTRPIQVFGTFGLSSLFMGLLSMAGLIYMKLAQHVDMTGNPLLLLTSLFVLIGIQFITIGLLGEINIRTYHESQKKPIYTIAEILDTVNGTKHA